MAASASLALSLNAMPSSIARWRQHFLDTMQPTFLPDERDDDAAAPAPTFHKRAAPEKEAKPKKKRKKQQANLLSFADD